MIKNREPLKVIVSENQWTAVFSPKSFRQTYLHTLLQKNEELTKQVRPGFYDFNIRRKGLKMMIYLTPTVKN